MTPFKRYIAEEIAVDHAEGLFTRREALRRLALMGITAGAATTLLAACSTDSSPVAPTATEEPTTAVGLPPGVETAVDTEAITFPGPTATLQGAWAAASNPRGAVLVLHENKGLTDHIRSIAGRLAGAGYSSLAIDLLSEEGGTASFTDPAEATAKLSDIPPERFSADMKAGLDELQKRAPGVKLGAVGFCFGGGLVWTLLASNEPRLAAAVPFYGPLPDNPDFAGDSAAVLAIYAGLDARVNASQPAATAALQAAGLTNKIDTVPDVDHAFFNDTGARYQPAAAAQVYQEVLDWFGMYLA
ncbi:carboxymethylenebutenolidase [Rhodococcoides trifolii]|uniref:Carboxymethylenebutenolidase n=1 Tax=Rhodococcoides trifolii TaxID=908250 RepID=A0A917LHB1_9NOCA|nr:dienelactone hydrolase family protein [Rhodococcus trifolii]GGG23642.1 carboxymethylenebutenolidase [Rhodococcus trifolii]